MWAKYSFSCWAFYRILVVLTLSLSVASVSWAGQWRSSKGLRLNTIYTDNKDLSDNDKEGELSLGITPSLGITGRGSRLSMDFRYAPSLRLRSSNSSSFNHNLASALQSELYKDIFFLDASANARQSLKNSAGRSGGDDANNNNDTTQTFNYTVNPYTRHHFGNYADSVLGYTFSQVINSSGDTSNSTGHDLYYTIGSGSKFPITPWGLSANYSQVDYDDGGDDSKTYHVEGTASYVLNRIWTADSYGFYDSYDIETDQNNDAGIGGGLGFTWTPSARTYLKAGYGYRVLTGWNLYFDFSHRSKRSTWTANLTHDVQTSRDEQLAQQTFDEDGNPIFDPDAADLTTDEYYVLDRFQTGYTLQGRRNSLQVNGYASNRVGEVSDDEQRNYGVSTSWRHDISAHTQSHVGVRWNRTDYDYSNNGRSNNDDNSDQDTWTFSTGLSHRLGPNTRLSFDLRHMKRTADRSEDEYDENRVSLTLSTNWN